MMSEADKACLQCGRSNRPGARYCKYCGTRLPQAIGERVPAGKRGLFSYLLVVLAVVLVALAAVYVYDELIAGGQLRRRAGQYLEEVVGPAYSRLIAKLLPPTPTPTATPFPTETPYPTDTAVPLSTLTPIPPPPTLTCHLSVDQQLAGA